MFSRPKKFPRSANNKIDTNAIGHDFEKRVAAYFRKAGKWNVRQNVVYVDHYGNKSEIDIVYGFIFKHYVECKTYSSKPVPLSDVAKFKEVLLLNRLPLDRYVPTLL